MKYPKIDPKDVKNFPADNPEAKIICQKGRYHVVERHYYYDSTRGRGFENRVYLGRVIDGEFLTQEEYGRRYKRGDKPRVAPLKPLQAQTPVKTEPVADAPEAPVDAKAVTSSKPKVAELTRKRVGAVAILDQIARQLGLRDDMLKAWDKAMVDAVLSIAYQWIITGKNSAYLHKSWASDMLVPNLYADTMNAKEVGELFAALAVTPGWEKNFFSARATRMDDDEVFSYDATNVATDAVNVHDAYIGKGKDGTFRRQIGMSVLFGHKSQQPVLFKIYPGNITDVTTVPDLLFDYDLIAPEKIVAAVLDRGYFSLKNIALFSDNNFNAVIAAKTDSRWVRDGMEKAMGELWSFSTWLPRHRAWAKTFEVDDVAFEDGKKRKLWLHIFRNDQKTHTEISTFSEQIEKFEEDWKRASESSEVTRKALLKSPTLKYFKTPTGAPGCCELERDIDFIDDAIRYTGFFASVSTKPLTAEQAISTYAGRDVIEKCFKAGKTDTNLDVVRSHSDKTVLGRFIVSFVAMSIVCELRRRMKLETPKTIRKKPNDSEEKAPLGEEMTLNEVMNYLSGPQMVNGRSGWRWDASVCQKQHVIAMRLGCADAYTAVPAFLL